jgi:hypothetical protein
MTLGSLVSRADVSFAGWDEKLVGESVVPPMTTARVFAWVEEPILCLERLALDEESLDV